MQCNAIFSSRGGRFLRHSMVYEWMSCCRDDLPACLCCLCCLCRTGRMISFFFFCRAIRIWMPKAKAVTRDRCMDGWIDGVCL